MIGAATLTRSPPQIQPHVEDEDDDADAAYLYPVHSVVSAAGTTAPASRSPASIFDAAAIVAAAQMLRSGGRFGSADGFAVTPQPTVVRDGGTVKVVGARYPADRWTDARHEQEQARRARQRPPKPTRRAKTRGKKVRRWDGEEFE